MNKITGKVNCVKVVENISPMVDLCAIVLEDLSSYYTFDSYDSLLQFVGKDVEFTTRKELYNDNYIDIIVTFNQKEIIYESNNSSNDETYDLDGLPVSSLIKESFKKRMNIVDFNRDSIKVGDKVENKTIFIYNYEQRKSSHAMWIDYHCLDAESRKVIIRFFYNMLTEGDVIEFSKSVKGKYAVASLISHTKYGYQIEGKLRIIEDYEETVPPEVYLSTIKLNSVLNSDKELKEYVDKYDLINILSNLVYYERGYHLVEMVVELRLIDTVKSIYPLFDSKLLKRAIFASRGYLIGEVGNRSIPVINYHRLVSSSLKHDEDLIGIIDVTSNVKSFNKIFFYEVKRLSKLIMEGIRDYEEENDIIASIRDVEHTYGRLF